MATSLRVYALPAVLTATAVKLNVGAGEPPRYAQAFVLRANTDDTIYIGDSAVSDASNGMAITAGEDLVYEGVDSRGETTEIDLTETYYIGGACQLIIEKRV